MTRDDQADNPLWPLAALSVGKLFGARDFSLSLNPDATVLTGENGSGKSTLLRALHLLGEEQWAAFTKLPLQQLVLTFHDGASLSATSDEQGLTISHDSEKWTFDVEMAERVDPRLLAELRHARTHVARGRRRPRAWTRDVLFHQGGVPPDQVDALITPDWLTELTARFRTKMISARRLEHRLRPEPGQSGEDAPLPVVEQFAQQLRDRMRDELSSYAAESRRQEKNLPAQIVQAMQEGPTENPEILADEVAQLRAEVKDLAESLARVGLFQEEDPDQQLSEYPRENPPILLAVREVYRVTKHRLERLTTLRSDLELFGSFLNRRFSNKKIELSQDTGIAVHLSSDAFINPSELSSGEQQLLALAYELLFGTKARTVVLLDEPELSLHVAWLQGLLTAFLDMGVARNLQFLIATHSPSVLVGHTELERSLDVVAE